MGQQKMLGDTPNPQIMPTKHDVGITIYNQIASRIS
jgi:hypothetical protein